MVCSGNVLWILLSDRFWQPCLEELPLTLLWVFDTDTRQIYLGSLAQLGLFACKILWATFKGKLALYREGIILLCTNDAESSKLQFSSKLQP